MRLIDVELEDSRYLKTLSDADRETVEKVVRLVAVLNEKSRPPKADEVTECITGIQE